ncbi:hypothetical protein [Chondrinema litorale]|uniref:hypothetical protein n=1 Tax=Chondrinema litorale TaxID=2994555 RepID=UPI002542F272|nr:hypothetical protein [Chondrinema litorale]UZR96087.1 hypothetical protein OQ292_09740 [Chondrinema litorale]
MTEEEYLQAKLYLQLKKYEHGLRYVKSLLTKSPEDDMLYAFLASCYQGLNKLDEAEIAINKAIGLAPSNYSHFKMASKIQLIKKNLKKAESFIDTAISLNASDPDLFGYKSIIMISQNAYSKALDVSKIGLEIDPDNNECLKGKALALNFLKKHDEAKSVRKRLLENNPENVNNLFVGGLVSLNDESNSSLQMMSLALKTQPNNPYIKEGYLIALRNQLFGFRKLMRFSSNFGRRDSLLGNTLSFVYIIFSILCLFNLYSRDLGFKSSISWILLYLVLWNVNLVIQLIVTTPIPLYDAWLFIFNKKLRLLYSSLLKIKIFIIISVMLISIGFWINIFYYPSIYFYQIALHISAAIPLIFHTLYSRNKNIYWRGGYLVISIFLCFLSSYQFNKDLFYFIIVNIAYRSLYLLYTKIIFNKI